MTFAYGATSLVVNGIIMPYPLEIVRYNSVGLCSDSTVKVRDEGVFEVFVDIVLHETHAKMALVRSFFETTVKLSKYAFTIDPDDGVNLTTGDGGIITVNYWGSNFIESMPSWHNYEYRLKVRRVYSI